MKLVRWNSLFFLMLAMSHCSSNLGSLEDWLGVLKAEDSPKVILFNPTSDAIGVDPKTSISIVFSHPMSIQSCVSAFSLEPQVRGIFVKSVLSKQILVI